MKALDIPGLDAVLESDIYEHCYGTTDREVGGVLIGTIERGAPPRVRASIRAAAADEAAAQLTFTQATWEHIHRELETEYPGLQIVGWYHSHPGYGLFLSEQDMFIHNNFFQNRSQIALVVDPVAGDEAVFAWSEDGVDEYFRRESTYQAAPAIAVRRPHRSMTTQNLSALQVTGAGASREVARSTLPPATWIYLLVIGLSAAIVVWELLLR